MTGAIDDSPYASKLAICTSPPRESTPTASFNPAKIRAAFSSPGHWRWTPFLPLAASLRKNFAALRHRC